MLAGAGGAGKGGPGVPPPTQPQALRQWLSLPRLQGPLLLVQWLRGGRQSVGLARGSQACVPLLGKKPLPTKGVAQGAIMEVQPGVLRAELREALAALLRLGVRRR